MDEMYRRAAELAPQAEAIARVADKLDDNFRRYIDGCYMKVSVATNRGSSTGYGSGSFIGGAAGRDWFVVWSGAQDIAWRSEWEGQVATDNATTAPCRILWSDIATDAARVRAALHQLEDEGRRRMIYPGAMRALRAAYRLRED